MKMMMLDRDDDDDDDVYNNYACNHFNFDVNDLQVYRIKSCRNLDTLLISQVFLI